MAKNDLTDKEKKALQEYLDKVDALKKKEPPRIEDTLTQKEYDEIWAYIESGKNPPACIDRITITEITDPDGTKHKGFYDTEWEKWNAECNALTDKYRDKIARALFLSLNDWKWETDGEAVSQILRAFLAGDDTDSLFALSYMPLLNDKATNDFFGLNLQSFTRDDFSKKATYTTDKGTTFTIRNYEKLQGDLGTPARKLFDTAVAHLAYNNYKNNLTRASVEINLIEYGEANGKNLTPRKMRTKAEQEAEKKRVDDRIKDFKGLVRRDASDIRQVGFVTEETRNRNGDYADMSLISSHAIHTVNGVPYLRINFDVDMAKYLLNSYVMYYPTALLKHDNRSVNAYAIGRKIALHNSLDNNAVKGTDNTLTVKSLLESAPEIISYETLKAQGRRDWKQKIKAKLEKALNANVDIGYIIRWEYRNPKTGKTYTPETANNLTHWNDYCTLDVDFVLQENPDQIERRARKQAEKASALADKKAKA